ncbi:hypothetical protein HK098_004058 [Nowakowskiella sp. JEL0407]|nr:hypothetical protein HK098_004058 [Nowakowskiella sp. JEL0407]
MSQNSTLSFHINDIQTVADSLNALFPSFNSFTNDNSALFNPTEEYANLPENYQIPVTPSDSSLDLEKYLDLLLTPSTTSATLSVSPTLTGSSFPSPASESSNNTLVDDLPLFSLTDTLFDPSHNISQFESKNSKQVYVDLISSLVNLGLSTLLKSDANQFNATDNSLGFLNAYGEFDFTLFPPDENSINSPSLLFGDLESILAAPPSPVNSCSGILSSPVPSLASFTDINGSISTLKSAREAKKPYTRPMIVSGHDLATILPGPDGKFKCPYENCVATHARRHNLKVHFETKHCKLRPFTCDKCKKDFTRKWDLKRHDRLKHTDEGNEELD